MENKLYSVGIYIRLSKEDTHLGESESVQNQKLLLMKYVKELEYSLFDVYIDDGYTGTNFDRPAFKRLIQDIEDKKVNMVITKDLSRLGRDYIGTGEFIEKWFPSHQVRYIALTDNIDTAFDSANNDIAPFKSILNDMYARDLSKKIRTALRTKQREGKWVGGISPFGYKVDPNDKNHLVIDPCESKIVKRIFLLFLKGYKVNQIKNILNKENVPTFSITRNRENCGLWSETTIRKILKNELYTGDMIQNRRRRVNYKYRKIINNPMNEWIRKENTHTPLISKEEFKQVQKLLYQHHQRRDKKEIYLLDGLLICNECKHTIGIRARRKNGKSSTICNYYRKSTGGKRLCTNHGFDYDTIEEEVLRVLKLSLKRVDIENILEKFKDKMNQEIMQIDNEMEKLKKNMEQLKIGLENLYIEKLTFQITDNDYQKISEKMKNRIAENQLELENRKEQRKLSMDEQKLKKKVHNFLNRKSISRNIVLRLIKKIVLHENGDVDIYLNFCVA